MGSRRIGSYSVPARYASPQVGGLGGPWGTQLEPPSHTWRPQHRPRKIGRQGRSISLKATQRLVANRSSMCYGDLMAKTIAQRQLRNDNAKVIEAVAAGESFVVTRNGVPVAELRPIQQTRRTFVPTAELLVLAATGPRINRKRFRADLDRVVDQGL